MFDRVLIVFEKKQLSNLKKYLLSVRGQYAQLVLLDFCADKDIKNCAEGFGVFYENAQLLSQAVVDSQLSKTVYLWMESFKSSILLSCFYTYWFDVASNNISLLLIPLARIISTLECFVNKHKVNTLISFGEGLSDPRIPCRKDVSFLYSESLYFDYVIESFSKQNMINYQVYAKNKYSLKYLKNKLRTLFISGYKFILLCRRVLDAKKMAFQKYESDCPKLLLIIRAASEFYSIKPFIDFCRSNRDTFSIDILQDDLLKSPSSKKVLDKHNYPYQNVHTETGLFELFSIYCRSFVKYLVIKRKLKTLPQQYMGFQYQLVAQAFLSELETLPEMMLFKTELNRKLNGDSYQGVITLDMIDRWVAIIGRVAKQHCIPSFTFYNASILALKYPSPVSTSLFLVGDKKAYRSLTIDNENDNTVMLTGLPLYDDIYLKALDINKSNKVKRFLITTQPFSSDYEKNFDLIRCCLSASQDFEDLEFILKVHPRESTSEYIDWVASLMQADRNRIKIEDVISVTNLISNVSGVISRSSTTLETALLYGVQGCSVISDARDKQLLSLSYLSSNVTEKVEDVKGLKDWIGSVLSGSTLVDYQVNRREYLEESGIFIDGERCRVISKIISDKINE